MSSRPATDIVPSLAALLDTQTLPEQASNTERQDVFALFAERLLNWYQAAGRHDLPWKVKPSPYRVWLSEIMLQQTQVATVLRYFDRFMTRFPNIQTLAKADEDAVLAAWTGLGYYRRARHLHQAAKQVVDQHGGAFPDQPDVLEALPGIGRSTAGAILALAFHRRAAILDGNVRRVLTRVHGIEQWPGIRSIEHRLWELAEAHTPHEYVAEYTQAIMDLGATVCTRSRPDCSVCPVVDICQAYQRGLTNNIPARAPARKKIPQRSSTMVILQDPQGRYWLEKRPEKGVWGGLWCFPELLPSQHPSDLAVQRCGLVLAELPPPEDMQHQFTHYRLQLSLHHLLVSPSADRVAEGPQGHWFAQDEMDTVGLAAPVLRLRHRAES